MYQADENKKIDSNAEIVAMIEFIESRWEGYDKVELTDLMLDAWTQALSLLPNRFDQYGFSDLMHAWSEERTLPEKWKKYSNMSDEEIELVTLYDSIYKNITSIIFGTMTIDRHIMKGWDFGTACNALTSDIKSKYKESVKMKPKGWNKLAKNYNDHDGSEEYCENSHDKDVEDFKGVNSDSAGASGFHGRVALPYVMYSEKSQGRKAFYELISAIVGHAMFVSAHNNTVSMKEELQSLKNKFDKPEYYKEIQFNINFIDQVESNVLKCMFEIKQKDEKKQTEKEFRKVIKKSIQSSIDYKILSVEAKAKRKEEVDLHVAKMISTMFSKEKKSPKEEEKEKIEKEKENQILTKYLDATPKIKIKNKM